MSTPPKRPKTINRLQRLITDWEGDSGLPVRRLNLRVASMMLAGALARSIDDEGSPIGPPKGGRGRSSRPPGRTGPHGGLGKPSSRRPTDGCRAHEHPWGYRRGIQQTVPVI